METIIESTKEAIKKYKTAEDFAENYLKDLAEENHNIYSASVYERFENASRLLGYKTEWFPSRVKELSEKQIDNIIKQYPEIVESLSKPMFWGKTKTFLTKREIERHILFNHFLEKEYELLERENLINTWNIINKTEGE